MTTAIILFAHGARDPEWALPMRRVQAAIRAKAPDLSVELAFLEFMSPDLTACAAEAIAAGASRVLVIPMFIAQGGHLKREVPELLAALRARWPGVQFLLERAIGEEESVVQAMAQAALQKAGATRT
jgi:sirohydrochlorin cobaltochelatase